MIFGKYPFYSSNFMHTFELIQTADVKFDVIKEEGMEWKNNPIL